MSFISTCEEFFAPPKPRVKFFRGSLTDTENAINLFLHDSGAKLIDCKITNVDGNSDVYAALTYSPYYGFD